MNFLITKTTLNVTFNMGQINDDKNSNRIDTATFGAGCFWCVEAIFMNLKGVTKVYSGYAGGKLESPTYKDICTGTTGHAEVVQVNFDPSQIAYKDLLEIFWQTHDPTTLNQQGADIGTQYRSVIFYHNEEQRELAESYKAKLNEVKAFDKPIITEILPLKMFYRAENYHQDYYNQNKDAPYCTYVIQPKLEKLKKVFGDKVKK